MEREKVKSPWLFFLLTYTFTWVFWTVTYLIPGQLMSFPKALFYILGACGPSVIAFGLTYNEKGSLGVKDLLKRSLNFRFNKVWLIPIFILIPLLFIIALIIDYLNFGTLPEMKLLKSPLLIIGNFIIMLFFGGSCQEEFGWRGYALEKLQMHYNALVSSLLLGIVWTFWHLPLFFIAGTGQSYMPLGIFLISTTALTIIFTWLYNNTNGSLLVALLLHTTVNLCYLLFPLFEMKVGGRNTAYLYYTVLISLGAAIVTFCWGPKTLTQKNNGIK